MNTRGFTLIETVVYLGLFTLIIGGFVAVSYMLFETSDRNQAKAILQEEKNFLIQKIRWVLHEADIVDVPNVGISAPVLAVTDYDGSVSRIESAGTDMTLNGRILNNANVTVSNVLFIRSGNSDEDIIEAGFTIRARMPNGMIISETASTTEYLRK